MKKNILFFIMAVCLCSCTGGYMNSSPVVTHGDVSQDRYFFGKIVEFEYKGHQYIWFLHGQGSYEGGIVHNPECNTCRGIITEVSEKLEAAINRPQYVF